MRNKPSTTTFYCFSPFVMAMTFIIELFLVLLVLLRHRRTKVVKLSVTVLLALAAFQLAEYGVCEDLGLSGTTWATFGFAAITLLPVLGLHLVYVIAKKLNKRVLTIAYASAAVWVGLFLFGGIMESTVCNGNYVIFNLTEGFGGSYFIYYYFWLLVGTFVAVYHAMSSPVHTKRALLSHTIGYAMFIIPATFIWIRYEGAAQGLPSIMCGFAVLYAILLALVVVPNATKAEK